MPPLTRTTLCWLVPLLLVSCIDTPGCGSTPPEMAREVVEAAVFSSESTVTYSDGQTPIGVFFEEEHRQPVSWDDLPPAWMVAIVAAEDGRFWTHSGVDPESVARAARDNAQAGTVVSGGSTLTQQTAKNLFDRPDRSLESKLAELDYALHLEKAYNKREILTFYANLFHVTGNGTGLGIAARYFFDKKPRDLTVLESAYLAGLVKGPANYDPFPGDAEDQAEATQRAHERTRYVLERIVAEPVGNLVPAEGEGKPVTQGDVDKIRAEAQRLLASQFTIPFKKGEFRYDSSVMLDEVERRLAAPAFQNVFADAGIADPKKAGLTIVTTLDVVAQHEATYGLWHHLSDLGVMLEGLDADVFVDEDGSPPKKDPNKLPRRHEFRTAQVTAHVEDHLEVDLGGIPCVLDRDAMVRAASSVHKGDVQDRYAKTPTDKVDTFVKSVPDGAVVLVSVRDTPSGEPALCDLEARPELQGSVVVLQDGQMRAMVGGTTNKDFNRATAPRQLGSTFKSIVYHAAMTMGWQPDDVLDNRRNIFPFSGTFYAPSPDHEPHSWVSLAWAGVNSENLASIWLMYHITDHLSPNEVASLAKTVGLAREAEETEEAYQKRIQEAGILPTSGRAPESHYMAAKHEVLTALRAQGDEQEARQLQSLYYGWGFETQRSKTSSSTERRALENSWLHISKMKLSCETQYENLERAVARGDTPSGVSDLSMYVGDTVEVACGSRPEGFVSVSEALRGGGISPSDDEGGQPSPAPGPSDDGDEPSKSKGGKGKGGKAGKAGKARPVRPESEASPGGGAMRSLFSSRKALPGVDELLVDDRIKVGTMEAISTAMERQKMVLEAAGTGLYDPEILYRHQDFRALLGIRYITTLAKMYGVKTELAQVLSLPLGASEITIEEAARMYEGITSGEGWQFEGTGPGGPADPVDSSSVLIAEIRDRFGKTIYKAEPKATRVTSAGVGQMTADVLRNVVQFGTGKSAKEIAKSGEAFVPLGGKTGTTNDFKNAAFVGYLPGATPSGYSAAAGYTVAVYVGYDDNRPMKVGKISVAGSVGALPAWIATVQALHNKDPGKGIAGMQPQGGFWPMAHGEGLIYRSVDTSEGLPGEGSGMVLTRASRAPAEDPKVADSPGGTKRTPHGRRKKPWWQVWQ
jgi:penicillin-binding protein 1A